MRSSRLAHRLPSSTAWAASSRGDAALQAAGYVRELGPGLVAGSPLFARVLARVEERLVAAAEDCGVVPVSLPASEGEALVNLLAQLGWAGLDAGVLALGTGFREQVAATESLGGLALYRRLDIVRLHPAAGGAPAEGSLLRALVGALAALGLPQVALEPDGLLVAPGTPAASDAPGTSGGQGAPDAPAARLGRCRTLPLPEAAGQGVALLVELDLHAVVAALAALHQDARGLCWPVACAPCVAALCLIAPGGEVAAVAAKLEVQLEAAGLPVLLLDDAPDAATSRQVAERLGLPFRVLCGQPASRGEVVVETRAGARPERVQVAELGAWLASRVAAAGGGRAEQDAGALARRTRRRRIARY